MKIKYASYFFLLNFIFACSPSISPVDDGLEKQILHFGNGTEPQGLDPHIVTGVPEHHLLISLCEGLTIANPRGVKTYQVSLSLGKSVKMGKLIHFF